MSDTKVKPGAKAAPAATPAKAGDKKKVPRPRNYDLGNGVYRFSRTRMFHKKAIYKFLGKKTEKTVSKFVVVRIYDSMHDLITNIYHFRICYRSNPRSH